MAKKIGNQLPADELSYFDKRMQLLGITPDINKVKIKVSSKEIIEDEKGNRSYKPYDEEEMPIFSQHEVGIEIMLYTLDRRRISYKPDAGGEKAKWSKHFTMLRYEKPFLDKNGREVKYKIPKGAGTHPFFPPSLIDKFERKEKMKNVYLTEGYFKAFKGAMHGLDIIGLSSITHMKDMANGALHEDIVTLIKSGLVERFIWLTDGDCLDITSKEITEDKDLYTRPSGFFNSISTFRNLLDDYADVEKWFAHIDTDNIVSENKTVTRDQVKGLDDLLCTFPDNIDDIVSDLNTLSRAGFYFKKFDLMKGLNPIRKHFNIVDVNTFFFFHCERRPELKTKQFKYLATKYLFNEEKNTCDVVLPGEANLYFRVGDDYYKHIQKPNQFGNIEKIITGRRKATIVDDHGKKFPQYIPKYEDFCNVPSHDNFQQVIGNCFNVYSPLDYTQEDEKCTEEDCPTIFKLLRHIWGDKRVSFKDKETGIRHEYYNWELGIDYLQLVYQQPAQKMPILCLVSKENGTGKSTLGFFLRSMLGANVAIVGNADLAGDFNAHWATKSIVICDEAKIDKHQVIEKIKALSTAKKIYMNAKGRGQVELDCFIKFLLITNNEETFITASEEDTRYWVLKVPVLQFEDPRIMQKLVDEIPAFLSYLNDRKLATEEKSRMWFHKDLLKTDALKRVIEYSAPTIVKDIKAKLRDLFMDTGVEKIMMTSEIIQRELLTRKNYEINYLIKILKEHLKVQPYHVWIVEGRVQEYPSQELAIAAAEVAFPDHKGPMIYSKIKQKFKTTRYSYPSYIEKMDGGTKERVRIEAKDLGRPYVFYKADFVSFDDEDNLDIGDENRMLASTLEPIDSTPIPNVNNSKDEPLPF